MIKERLAFLTASSLAFSKGPMAFPELMNNVYRLSFSKKCPMTSLVVVKKEFIKGE